MLYPFGRENLKQYRNKINKTVYYFTIVKLN